jgi:iron complex transport system substrate-binding protein
MHRLPFILAGSILGIIGCATKPPAAATQAVVPARIVAFAPSSTEIIAALGAADRLVAVGTFCIYPPQLASLPKIGGQFDPDLEGVLRLRPDLVVLRGHNQAVEQLCAARHIALYRDPTETLGTLYRAIREIGDILDRRNAAETLVTDVQTRLQAIADRVSSRPRPRVFVAISRRDPDSLAGILTTSNRTFMGELITLAGGENVFGHLEMDYPEVSPEAIVAAAPDVIIEPMPEAKPDPWLSDRVLAAWQRLGPVPAVAEHRIYVLTDDNALIPSPRVVGVVAALARRLHPEAAVE